MSGKYDDILHLPHPEPIDRPRMSMLARAAQFAPFAALTGYDDEVKEAARLTDRRLELSEDTIAELDEKLQCVIDNIGTGQETEFTHFVPDAKKSGGAYVTHSGVVKKVDDIEHIVIMADGKKIPIYDIVEIMFKGNLRGGGIE